MNDSCYVLDSVQTRAYIGFCGASGTGNFPDNQLAYEIIVGGCGCLDDITATLASINSNLEGLTQCVPDIVKAFTQEELQSIRLNDSRSGEVRFYCNNSEPVENVTICGNENGVCACTSPCSYSDTTNASGQFDLPNCSDGKIYQLKACKNDEAVCGVSTLDQFDLQQHLLGLDPLESWQYIAADLNGSGTISTIDVIRARKLFLGIDTSFALPGLAWRFLPCDVDLSIENPFLNEEGENIHDSLYDQVCLRYFDPRDTQQPCFNAIKVGDVNGDCGQCNESGVAGSLTLDIAVDSSYLPTRFILDFGGGAITDLAAFQFALEYDTAQLKYIQLHERDLSYIDQDILDTTAAKNGNIKLAWYSEDGTPDTLLSSGKFLGIEFEYLGSGYPNANSVWLNAASIDPAIYLADGKKRTISLSGSSGGSARINGFENEEAPQPSIFIAPNPFANYIQFIFNGVEGQNQAHIYLYSVNGNLVYSAKHFLSSGKNIIELENLGNFTSGVYYYKVLLDERAYTGTVIKKW